MSLRSSVLIGAAAVFVAAGAGPAFATDDPAPPGAGPSPGGCTDATMPTSKLGARSARNVAKGHLLRGRASDAGCGVDGVDVSLLRREDGKCRHLTQRGSFSKPANCRKLRWLDAKGASRWQLRVPGHFAKGRYAIRTRATDFAGNVQKPELRRLVLR